MVEEHPQPPQELGSGRRAGGSGRSTTPSLKLGWCMFKIDRWRIGMSLLKSETCGKGFLEGCRQKFPESPPCGSARRVVKWNCHCGVSYTSGGLHSTDPRKGVLVGGGCGNRGRPENPIQSFLRLEPLD